MENTGRQKPKSLGTTFSQLQCRYLDLDYKETFQSISSMGFDYIRLCAYWNEIEPVAQQYDFSILDWLIEQSSNHSMKIVLAVGMKAPRWPEFHFPRWIEEAFDTSQANQPLDSDTALREHALKYLERLIDHTKDAVISFWQVENEALNKPGVASGRYLSQAFIQQEIDLVKRISGSNNKILLTNSVSMLPFGNDDKNAVTASLPLADAIGLNVYTKVPLNESLYMEAYPFFWKKLAEWQAEIVGNGKEAWVAEAQAEPWEWHKLVATDKSNYPSTSPEAATELVLRLGNLGYDTILLWGCEYWYWQMKHGNLEWLQAIEKLIQQ